MKKQYILFIFLIASFLMLWCAFMQGYHRWEQKNADDSQYVVFVEEESNRLYLFYDGMLRKEYKCAIGSPVKRSPEGSWNLVKKERWEDDHYYLGLNVSWGDFGICSAKGQDGRGSIKIYGEDAAELYHLLPFGTKVVIEKGYSFYQFRTLEPGMEGTDVFMVQKRLSDLGYYHGETDGRFDQSLVKALSVWQKKNKIAPVKKITPVMMQKMGFALLEK